MCSFVVIFLLFFALSTATEPTVKTKYVCPSEFHTIGKKCYHFSKQSVMWTDSHFYCQLLNSTVLIFNSNREQNLLRGFLIHDNYTTVDVTERWTDGIYDWQQKRWKWGSTGAFISDTSFTRAKIGNRFKWSCLALDGVHNNRWLARRCTEYKPVICETETNVFVEFKLYNKKKKKFNITRCSTGEILEDDDKRRCMRLLGRTENEPQPFRMRNPGRSPPRKRNFDGWICPSYMIGLANRCYYFSTTAATWADAHFECRRNGTKLAIIRNKPQDHNLRMFLNNFIEKHDRWIGGIYDWKIGKWRWALTGQPIVYRGFNAEVMKQKQPEELAWNSIFMDPKIDNQWNSAKQTEKKRFICQVMAKGVKRLARKKVKTTKATITILTNKKPKKNTFNTL